MCDSDPFDLCYEDCEKINCNHHPGKEKQKLFRTNNLFVLSWVESYTAEVQILIISAYGEEDLKNLLQKISEKGFDLSQFIGGWGYADLGRTFLPPGIVYSFPKEYKEEK